MYQYRYINRLEQFGVVEYTLILEDNDKVMPVVRMEKTFKTDSSLIDESFLNSEAQKEIDAAIVAYDAYLISLVPPEEDIPPPDDGGGDS